jgi:hypothetical protein
MYRIFIEPGIDEEKILKALKVLPGYFKFEFKDWSDLDYSVYEEGDWKGFIMPSKVGDIAIFDGIKHEARFGGGTISNRCGIAVFGGESIFELGLRIWHELLHAKGMPADSMLGNLEFIGWMDAAQKLSFTVSRILRKNKLAHSSKWQVLYYHFLTQKLLEGD